MLELGADPAKARVCTVPYGSVLLFSNALVHRSLPNNSAQVVQCAVCTVYPALCQCKHHEFDFRSGGRWTSGGRTLPCPQGGPAPRNCQ